MAILWNGSLIPWTDASGDPYAGAKAYFFDSGTTTPQVTYTTAALSIPHDHPVVANASGMFPAIFLVEETIHRLRITDADDATIWDVDAISVPTTVPPEAPSGETDAEFLYQTGDIKMAWRTAAPTGYVRLNGRTIGSASSGATERANADCEDLFEFLWTQDANLAVSGGRGGSSASDWAANKTIALPDWRGRVPGGLDSMGNSASGRITDAVLGTDSDTLGGAGGAQTHALIIAELAAHDHNVALTDGGHRHFGVANVTLAALDTTALTSSNQVVKASNDSDSGSTTLYGTSTDATIGRTSSATTGITVGEDTIGSGTAHNNLQPTVLIPFFIKL